MSGPLRVLHAHSGNLYGGVESILVTLAGRRPELLAHQFALCFRGTVERALRQAGAAVTELGPVRLSRPWTVVRARRELRRLIATTHPDVVVCHSAWSLTALGPAARAAGARLALWLHAPPTGRGWLERLARRRVPDRILCNSLFTRSALPRLFPGRSADVVYPPVAGPAPSSPGRGRAELRREHAAPPDAVVIVQVSRLEPWKGQRTTLEALARLVHLPGWVCWMVGTPQRADEAAYLRSLEDQARALGLRHRVRFLVGDVEVRNLLAAADVFCQPNAEPEPFGVVFVEALYAGLPVVSFAMGGVVEIVDPACGILAPVHDTAALATALEQLIVDPTRRAALGAAGPSRARAMCDPDAGAARLAAVLSANP